MKKIIILAAVVLLAGALSAEAGLINAGFETGDFTGWTTFNQPGGISYPTVTMFDVDNDTVSSYAARFQVGHLSGYSASLGGGIYQDVDLLAGPVSLQADIASYCTGGTNSSGGRFYMYLDDTQLAYYDFASINSGSVEYSTLIGSTTVTEGTHTVKFLMTRPYTTGYGDGYTPYQYIDNVLFDAQLDEGGDDQQPPEEPTNAVPEPMTALLFSAGLAGAALRKKL